MGKMTWGERGAGDKEISASSSSGRRLEELLGSCFGVEGEVVEPESDSQSKLDSRVYVVVRIEDKD